MSFRHILIAIALTLFFVGCTGSTTDAPSSTPAATAAPDATATPDLNPTPASPHEDVDQVDAAEDHSGHDH